MSKKTTWYAVHDPAAARESSNVSPTVFEDIHLALGMLRTCKEARMRSFGTIEDANQYSNLGYSTVVVAPVPKLQQQQPEPSPVISITTSRNADGPAPVNGTAPAAPTTVTSPVKKSVDIKSSSNGTSNGTSPTPSRAPAAQPANGSAPATEKPSFRGPKSQELVQFRKLIEQSKYELVRETVWRNPRFLIGSGDTPALLKESTRYNALHVAALAKNAAMCELLLDIVGDPTFIQLLLGAKNAHHCTETGAVMRDMYLNMPERGRHETPLHLAAKFGAVDVVNVLTSYEQCASVANSEGLLPSQIICSRVNNPDPAIVAQIEELLNGRFYVPVLRSVDNTVPPMIGEPFSPKNPLNLQFDLLSPEMEIQAYAGPMNREEAHTFRRRWKTPPRAIVNNHNQQQQQQHNNSSAPNSPYPTAWLRPDNRTPEAPNHIDAEVLRFTPAKVTAPEASSAARSMPVRRLFGLSSPATSPSPVAPEGGRAALRQNAMQVDGAIVVTSTPPPKRSLAAQFDIDAALSPTVETPPFNHSLADNSLTISADLDAETAATESTTNPSPSSLRSRASPSPQFRTYRNQPSAAQLDDSLQIAESPMFRERHAKLCDSEKGLEVIGRELAKQRHIRWSEYWPFLDEFVDIRADGGLAVLERHLAERAAALAAVQRLKAEHAEAAAAAVKAKPAGVDAEMSQLCRALTQLEFAPDAQPLASLPSPGAIVVPVLVHQAANGSAGGGTAHQRIVQQLRPPQGNAFSAYLCAEKSWQVYAKRVTDALRNAGAAAAATAAPQHSSYRDALLGELRRLRSLVCSYRDDERFAGVDFGQAHSRFAHLLVGGLLFDQAAAGARRSALRTTTTPGAIVNTATGADDAAPVAASLPEALQRMRAELQHVHDTVAATNVPTNGPPTADLDLQCVLANALHYLSAGGANVVAPLNAGLTEEGARVLWTTEERCRCEWSREEEEHQQQQQQQHEGSNHRVAGQLQPVGQKQQQQRHLKRASQRMELERKQQQQEQQEQHLPMETVPDKWSRRMQSASSDDDDDDDENELYLSDSGSDDDVYFTPPESMSPCSPCTPPPEPIAPPAYDNFVMGREPTKTDLDVLNALADVAVAPLQYPHIHRWRDAMQQFSIEQRNAFAAATPLSSSKSKTTNNRNNAKAFRGPQFSLLRRLQVNRLLRGFDGCRAAAAMADDAVNDAVNTADENDHRFL